MYSSHFRFTLDLQKTQSQVSVPVTRGDTARSWLISFRDGAAPYALPDGTLAKLEIKRPTGTHIEEFCPIENRSAVRYSFSQNTNTAAVEGIHECAVILFDGEGNIIGSPRFMMIVSDRVVSSDDINLSDEDKLIVESMVTEEASRQRAEAERINAESARIAAEAQRTQDEAARQTADTERALAEESRAKGFETLQKEINTAAASLVSPTVTVTPTENGNRITVTDQKGEHAFSILNGTKGEQGPRGLQGPQGPQGIQGVQGKPFAIEKTFSSVSEMNDGFATDGVSEGGFVIIASGVETEDNAKLFVKGKNAYTFVTDLSGAQGLQGPQGEQGPQGLQGIPGKSAYQYAQEMGYVGTEEGYGDSMNPDTIKAEFNTYISEELAKRGQLKPEFANDISECTDTTKLYVLPDGYIYAYMNKENVSLAANKFVPSTATLNSRMSGSSGSVSAIDASKGSFVTDYIAVSGLEKVTPYNVRFNWALPFSEDNKVVFYNSSKTRIGNALFANMAGNSNTTISNNETVVDLKIGRDGEATNVSDYAEVAYVRFQAFVKPIGTEITSADIANCKITFDAENEITNIVGFQNTGNAFVPADYEERIWDLEEDIKTIKSNIFDLKNGLNNEEITVPDFWEDSVNACIAKIKSLQTGRNCVTFPFFSDNHQRNGYAGLLIAKIMKECHIPYAFFGGDSIDSGYIASEAVMIAQDKAFDDVMAYIPNGRFCRAVGNHDGYWAVSADEKHDYTDAQNYELFLREESVAQNKHFGGDGTYYYVNDIASKVRWIVLDTNDGTVETEQITWLQNTALVFSESGWAVVFISHQPISNHYHAGISNAEAVRTVVKNYIIGTATNKADVVGWFSGHIHRDRIYTGAAVNTIDDSVGADMGFKQITITSDHTSIAYDDTSKHTVANDDQSHAIDFVTINKKARTVNLTRLGIGTDRSYTY